MDMKEEDPKTSREIKPEVAMAMNRHQRRALGKLNGVKIPGSNKPIVNPPKGPRYSVKV